MVYDSYGLALSEETLVMPNVNILLIDDRPENLLSLEAILAGLGYNLVKAGSGMEALRQLLKQDFALILLDVQMPDMDGFETATLIRQREKLQNIPIIFITAINRTEQHLLRGYEVGAVDYLFKPFNPDILRAKVAFFVDSYQKSRALQEQARRIEEINRQSEQQLREVQRLNVELVAANRELRDLTAKLSAALEQVESAEQADKLKIRFLAMISHELRTPLTSIKGFATTLLSTDVAWDADSQRHFVTIINDEADKLTDLIDQLLDLSQLAVGRLAVHREVQPFNHIIEMARTDLDMLTANHQFVIELPPELPPVLADPRRIAQVLVNLVGNAAKFAPGGTPITLSATCSLDEIQISVRDAGPGIAVEDRTRVFEAFRQAEHAIMPRTGGAGLGLAICKGVIEAHGGRIWVADTPPPGTVISFTLPVHRPNDVLPTE